MLQSFRPQNITLKASLLKNYGLVWFALFQIVEFDSPSTLLATPDSTFSKLVQATEIEAEDHYLVE